MSRYHTHSLPLKEATRLAVAKDMLEEAFAYHHRCKAALADFDQGYLNGVLLLESQFNNKKSELGKALLTRDVFTVERNRICRALLADAQFLPDTLLVGLTYTEHIRLEPVDIFISATEMRRLLEDYVRSYGFKSGVALLQTLGVVLPALRELNERYQRQHWVFNHQEGHINLNKWLDEKGKLNNELIRLIQNLVEANITVANWEQVLHKHINTPTLLYQELDFLLFPEAEDIQELTENATVDKDKYRRLLHLAQNAYKVGDFKAAYDYCQEILQHIEPESPQLYQYLLLNFRHITQDQDIVAKALAGQERDLMQLFLYVGRIKSLDNARNTRTETNKLHRDLRSRTIAEVGSFLAISLQNAINTPPPQTGAEPSPLYVGTLDILLPPSNLEQEAKDRKILQRFLEVGSQIIRFVGSGPAIASAVINELAGGGRYAWIQPNLDQAGVFPIDKTPFPALSHFQNLRALTTDPYARQDQARQVYNNLKLHHHTLDEHRTDHHHPEAYGFTARWVKRCVCAYLLFDHDRDFLQLAYDLELNVERGLPWFEVGFNGQLQPRAITWEHENFDALQVFDFVVTTLFGIDGWKHQEQHHAKIAQQRLHEDNEQLYQHVRSHKADIPEEEGRAKVAICLKNWLKLYKATLNPLYTEQLILSELLGKGIYQWHRVRLHENSEELVPLARPDLDVKHLLDQMLLLTTAYDALSAEREVAANLFAHNIRQAYQRIVPNAEEEPAQRRQILDLLRQSLFLHTIDPEPAMLELVFNELIEEQKYAWLQVNENGLHHDDTPHGMEALALLQRLSNTGEATQPHLAWDQLMQALAHRHYRRLERQYKEDFGEMRWQNWRSESRRQMVRLLQHCVRLYRATGRYEYLFYPYYEWIEHSGRLRWRWRLLFFEWERWQNYEVGNFYYTRERREVHNLLRSYSRTALPWGGRR